MKRAFASIAAALVAPALISTLGCPGSTSATPEEVCTQFVDAFEAFYARCAEISDVVRNRDAAIRECQVDLNAPGATYGAIVSQCADALAQVDCDGFATLIEPGAACAPPPGTLAAGAGCIASPQCESLQCNKSQRDAGRPEYCGTCAARARAGERCSFTDGTSCEQGLRCQVDEDAGQSNVTGTCVTIARANVGEPCSNDSNDARGCAAGLSCRSGVCLAPAKLGQSCEVASCGVGTYCAPSTKICTAAPKAGDPCVARQCGGGHACVNDFCVAVSYAGSEAPCDGRAVQCSEGACQFDLRNPDAGIGDARMGKCPRVIAEGGPCGVDPENTVCAEPAECYDGICQMPDPGKCP